MLAVRGAILIGVGIRLRINSFKEEYFEESAEEAAKAAENTADVEVEYIQEKLDLDMSDPAYRQFSRIFEAFKIKDSDDDGSAVGM